MSHLRRMTPASSSSPSPRRTDDISLSLCAFSVPVLPSSKTAHVPTHAHASTSRSYQPTPRFFLCPLPLPRSPPPPFFLYGSKYCKFKRYVHAHAHGRNFSAPIKSDDAGRGFSIYYEISLWVYKLVNDALAPLKRTPTRAHHGKRINRPTTPGRALPLLFFRSLPLPFPVPLFFCATSSRAASSFIRVISRVPPTPLFFSLYLERLTLFTRIV